MIGTYSHASGGAVAPTTAETSSPGASVENREHNSLDQIKRGLSFASKWSRARQFSWQRHREQIESPFTLCKPDITCVSIRTKHIWKHGAAHWKLWHAYVICSKWPYIILNMDFYFCNPLTSKHQQSITGQQLSVPPTAFGIRQLQPLRPGTCWFSRVGLNTRSYFPWTCC